MALSIRDFLFPNSQEREAGSNIDRQMMLGLLRGQQPSWGGVEDMPSPPGNPVSGNWKPDVYGPMDLTPSEQRQPGYMLSPVQFLQSDRGQALMRDLMNHIQALFTGQRLNAGQP